MKINQLWGLGIQLDYWVRLPINQIDHSVMLYCLNQKNHHLFSVSDCSNAHQVADEIKELKKHLPNY